MLRAHVTFRVALSQRERGASAVEYALIVALIAALIIGVVATLGDRLADALQSVIDQLPGGAALRRPGG